MNRRSLVTSLIALGFASKVSASNGQKKKILLRSSWQTVNIGDIAHTPGVLAILEKYLPETEVWLWPSDLRNGVKEMLEKRFPNVRIIAHSELATAFEQCDFLLHGSGPSIVAASSIVKWKEKTGKPYGIYGVTFSDKDQIELINNAAFAYFRDSISLQFAKNNGATCPIMEFGPDGAFACDLTDTATSDKFLKENGLEKGKFLCCIPRYRYTPYWLIKAGSTFDKKRDDRNQEMKEHDHAPLRAAIEAVVRQTDHKILICPEDQTQMAIGKEMLYDKLPKDVLDKVVLRQNYWLTNEALSTYRASSGLFGLEMHSPIMCIGNGIPAIVCRFSEQTSKGLMWKDIGLSEWLFDMDKEDDVKGIVPTVLSLIQDPKGTAEKVAKGKAAVNARQKASMIQLAKSLNS
jgi:polysaccharide pyruvyl transferase WcaK-like protein